jgi:hypothetical protein
MHLAENDLFEVDFTTLLIFSIFFQFLFQFFFNFFSIFFQFFFNFFFNFFFGSTFDCIENVDVCGCSKKDLREVLGQQRK